MREIFYAVIAVAGAAIGAFFGGWDAGMTTLLALMGLDYLTGLVVAGVFHESPKTDGGGLESRAGWKGLCRKGVTLVIVFIAFRLDILLDTSCFRNGAAMAFIVNEALSIIENAGLMGVPMPKVVMNAIEVLKAKTDGE